MLVSLSGNRYSYHLDMNSTVQRLNSLVPVGNILQNARDTTVNAMNSGVGVIKNATLRMNSGVASVSSGWLGTPLMWFVGFLVIFLMLLALYYYQFMDSLQNWIDSLNMWFTGKGSPNESSDPTPVLQTSTTDEDTTKHPTGVDAIVEKMLPPAKDVFTVSKNEYSYYDAAPLCKALGAELATYDEVKRAWQKGADWCNYGWVKGQMAVYPTQKSTYEELQHGPTDQRGVCGKPGLNGGYFDNPELKFGVTCSGKRPSQTDHDATAVTSGATRPLTASGIEFEQKVQEFKDESDTLGVLPFNKKRWAS